MKRPVVLLLLAAFAAAASALAWGAPLSGAAATPKPAAPAKPMAAAAPASADAEAVLKAKGLVRVNGVYLTEFDARLYPNLAGLRAAKAKVMESEHMRAIAARDVRSSRRA